MANRAEWPRKRMTNEPIRNEPMMQIDGSTMVEFFRAEGITHLVWIPDSTLGKWDQAVSSAEGLTVIRPTREGEAIAIGAGLCLGGQRPIVAIQNTGFFEAGDALRNAVHDMKLPLFLIVGYRSFFARQTGSRDTAAKYIEPILEAWELKYTLIDRPEAVAGIGAVYRQAQEAGEPHVLLIAE